MPSFQRLAAPSGPADNFPELVLAKEPLKKQQRRQLRHLRRFQVRTYDFYRVIRDTVRVSESYALSAALAIVFPGGVV